MSPVVAAALLICSHHVHSYMYQGTMSMTIDYLHDPMGLLENGVYFNFAPEYSDKCNKLIVRIKAIRQADAEREYIAEEKIRSAKAQAAAKKDQPTLDAAIAAVFAK